MPKSTKKLSVTYRRTNVLTDRNYRKASLKKKQFSYIDILNPDYKFEAKQLIKYTIITYIHNKSNLITIIAQ